MALWIGEGVPMANICMLTVKLS